MLGSGDTQVNETDTVPALMDFIVWPGRVSSDSAVKKREVLRVNEGRGNIP